VTLEALRAYQDQQLLYDGNVFEDSLPLAQAQQLAQKITQLNAGECYVYPTGFAGHAIYLTIERRDLNGKEGFLFRVDNLDGIDKLNAGSLRHHVLDSSEKAQRVYPAAFWTPRAAFLQDPLPYLTQLAWAKGSTPKTAIPTLYDNLPHRQVLSREYIALRYPSRKKQVVNNCSVKNWQVGMQIRWQQGNQPEAEGAHNLYRWFRQEEPTYLKTKHYKMKAHDKSLSDAPVVTPSHGQSHYILMPSPPIAAKNALPPAPEQNQGLNG
ncbi:MAG: hypothetical protein K2Q33_02980, partial [Gammaproteobacteria bacterium]|nr:hypothetical protein [Gammaproteobacteria bacterium]